MLESHCSLVLLFPLSLSVASKVLGWGNVETGRRVLTSCLKCSCLYKQPRDPNLCQGKTNMYFYFPCSFWGVSALLLTAVLHLRTFWGGHWGGVSIVSWSGASRDYRVSRFLSAEGPHVKLCNLLAQLLTQLNWLAQQTILVPTYLPWHSQGST